MENKILSLIPKKFRFESQLAARHLRAGGGQTLLTVSVVAAGVIIVVFITALIFGLQNRIQKLLTENLSHVTITAEERKPVPIEQVPDVSLPGLSSTRVEQQAAQVKNIANWTEAVRIASGIRYVRVVAPVVSGSATVYKGANPTGVSVVGADPELQDQVSPVTKNLLSGHYLGLGSDEIVMDYQTCKDANLVLGDRVKLTTGDGASESFKIVGIYSTGQGRGSSLITLRTAQSLFGLGASVNAINMKVTDINKADEVADQLTGLLPYKIDTWSRTNPTFVSTIRSQSYIAYLISGFSLIASSFAIAAILIVSVLQQSKQIGILKSMGARHSQILKVFLLEGLGIALAGGPVGAVIGTLIVYGLTLFKQPVGRGGAAPDQLFPIAVLPNYIALAILAAIVSTVIAALLPARRAARLNPVDVMR
jgi:lipoprotein-releasing system permease protein